MLPSSNKQATVNHDGIQLSQLNKSYQTQTGTVLALKDIDLEVQPGEIFGIIGKSGAGKSSLLRCVNLLEQPTSGVVRVAGQTLTALTAKELRVARRSIGMIFQHFNLLSSATVYENIALPLHLAGYDKQRIETRVRYLLQLTHLEDKRSHYPYQLSGGQKQRVAIARALANHPSVLLCDEATSALDPATTQSILELLNDINRELQLTILLITHEMEVIKTICDRVAVLDQGQIVEQSKVIDFFIQPQTAIGACLIKETSLHRDLPQVLQQRLSAMQTADANPLIRIFFQGKLAEQPLISQLAKQFGLELNILQANIETLRAQTIGVMVLEVTAEQQQLDTAMAYLKRQGVNVEVLGYVSPAH